MRHCYRIVVALSELVCMIEISLHRVRDDSFQYGHREKVAFAVKVHTWTEW